MENKIQNLNIGDKLTETDLVFYGYMLDIHLLPISIQPSFKSTIGFVGLNVGHTNPMVNLKMSWVGDGFVSFSEKKKKRTRLSYIILQFLDGFVTQRRLPRLHLIVSCCCWILEWGVGVGGLLNLKICGCKQRVLWIRSRHDGDLTSVKVSRVMCWHRN